MKMSKRILFPILFLWLSSAVFTAFAQQKTGMVYTSRSVPQEDMSSVSWKGDDRKPIRLSELYLRANLLRWATLTPDLGVEWRIKPSWGISVNGSWTSWSWNDKDKRYALWEVMPELRYYLGKERCGYLGAMFKTGQFNYKLSATGKQGNLFGGGVTGGYLFRLNGALSLDFSMGVGCLHADYDKYAVTGGVRVRRGSGNKNYWGVSHLGVSLVWNVF